MPNEEVAAAAAGVSGLRSGEINSCARRAASWGEFACMLKLFDSVRDGGEMMPPGPIVNEFASLLFNAEIAAPLPPPPPILRRGRAGGTGGGLTTPVDGVEIGVGVIGDGVAGGGGGGGGEEVKAMVRSGGGSVDLGFASSPILANSCSLSLTARVPDSEKESRELPPPL